MIQNTLIYLFFLRAFSKFYRIEIVLFVKNLNLNFERSHHYHNYKLPDAISLHKLMKSYSIYVLAFNLDAGPGETFQVLCLLMVQKFKFLQNSTMFPSPEPQKSSPKTKSANSRLSFKENS